MTYQGQKAINLAKSLKQNGLRKYPNSETVKTQTTGSNIKPTSTSHAKVDCNQLQPEKSARMENLIRLQECNKKNTTLRQAFYQFGVTDYDKELKAIK